MHFESLSAAAILATPTSPTQRARIGSVGEKEMKRAIVLAGALLGGSAVGLGAFGAHALKGAFSAEQAGWWQTGVQYQMWHALALLLVAALPVRRAGLAAACLGIGAIVFSGTLYLMALGAPRWLGAVTPVGGVLMIAGWAVVAWGAWFSSQAPVSPTP